jgi:hypothetical protein
MTNVNYFSLSTTIKIPDFGKGVTERVVCKRQGNEVERSVTEFPCLCHFPPAPLPIQIEQCAGFFTVMLDG